MAALLPLSVDYTDKDFDSARRRLFALIQSVFPTWTDVSVANFGNILLEMFAWCMDVLGFYQDNQAIESRITTATQRRSLIALAKLVNYEQATALASQGFVTFTANPVPPSGDPVVLGGAHNPFPIVVKTADGAVKYELQQTVTLTSAAPAAAGLIENSQSFTEVFTAQGYLGEEITLSRSPYLGGSAAVVAGNGGYLEVASFLNSAPSDRHFTVQVDNNDIATLRFGNQVSGALPTGTIVATYKTGGGAAGNVEAGAINQLTGAFTTESGSLVNLTVSNAAPTEGGAERESEAQIREKAPLSLRVLTRAVAREDFEILAVTQGGMARALMLTCTEDPAIPVNTGYFYMVPPAARGQHVGFPTPAQMDAVLRNIRNNFPYPTTFAPQLRMVTFVEINITAKVYLRKGYTTDDVRAQVLDAYTDYFALYNLDGSSNTRVDFGFHYQTGAADEAKVVPLSDLMNALRDCDGIQRLGVAAADFTLQAFTDNNTGVNPIRLVPGTHSDVPILSFEFPRFGSVVLVDGATGQVF